MKLVVEIDLTGVVSVDEIIDAFDAVGEEIAQCNCVEELLEKDVVVVSDSNTTVAHASVNY